MPSVESVLMDALKYAHHILIEKINQWKHLQQSHDRQRMERERMDRERMDRELERQQMEREQIERQQLVASTQAVSTADGSALTAPLSRPSMGEYCDGAVKHDMTQVMSSRLLFSFN